MKKSNRFIAFMLVGIMLFLVSACSAKSEKVGNKEIEKRKEIEIRLSSRWGGEEPLSRYFNEKIEEFNAQQNGITIVADNVTDEKQYFDKLTSQFGANVPPNIFINYGGSGIKDYIEGEVLLDLEPYFQEDGVWKESFLPLFEKWEKENKIYGVPVMLYQIMLYYNKDILEKHGLAVPTTIEELEKVSEELVKRGETAFMLGESSNFRAGHLFNNLAYKAYGTYVAKKLAIGEIQYDSQEMTDLYALIKRWNEKGIFGKNPLSVDNNAEKAAFLSGKSAFRFDGSWFVGDILGSEVEKSLEVAPFPYFENKEPLRTAVQGGSGQGFSITDSGNKEINDAAVKVVKFLTSKEYYAGLEKVNNGGIYPVKFDSLKDTKISEMTMKIKKIVAESKMFGGDLQEFDPEPHMLNSVRTALQGLFLEETPESCAKQIMDARAMK